MGNKSPLLALSCSLFILFLVLFPRGLITARKLAEDPQTQNDPKGDGTQDNGQSKGNVQGSTSRHGGSATGEGSPSGTVLMTPPTTATKLGFGRVTVVSANNTEPSTP